MHFVDDHESRMAEQLLDTNNILNTVRGTFAWLRTLGPTDAMSKATRDNVYRRLRQDCTSAGQHLAAFRG